MTRIWKYIHAYRFGVPLMVLIVIALLWASGKSIHSHGSLLVLKAFALQEDSSMAGSGSDVIQAERIDAFVSEQMKRHRLPGLALAVVDGDQVVLMKGYGKADQTGRPVTPQTPFLLASVSKPLTAAAIMQLKEAGKVDLDAPVQRYIPEFQLADPAASGRITVRHLLLHTSGIPVTACDTRSNAQTLAEFIAELRTVEPDAPAGSRHSYCSGNYNILGRVIEKVSGQSFSEYMQENVFTNLEMQNSFTTETEAKAAGMAQGYQFLFGLPLPTHFPYNPSQLPSGYMISSAEDMSHFLVSQLNGGQYDGSRLLSAASVEAMQQPGTSRSREGGYGLGWVIAPVGDVPAVWHDGINNNYHNLLLMLPERRRGAVILINSFNIVAYESAYREIGSGVARLLAGMEPQASTQTLGNLYLKINTILAVLLMLVLWPLVRMRKWHHGLLESQQAGRLHGGWLVVRAVWEIGFALAFLIGIRMVVVTGLGAQSWYEVLAGFPDFVIWIWTFASVVLLTGIIRLGLILKTRRTRTVGNRFVSDPPSIS